MTRPYVQIDAANQIAILRQHLEEMLPRFTAFQGVAGLTLNGGLSRGYADHLSEIDVTFYLEPEAYEAWRSGKAPISVGITVLDGQLYDIKYLSYAAEKDRVWDHVTLWDTSYAEILHDPQGLVHVLFSEKLGERPDPSVAEGFLMSCWWYFELAGEIWIHRGDVLQGHHMFNQAVVALVQVLFAANREYIPHEKWLLHLSRSLDWRPTDWERRLGAAMSTGDLTVETLRARQKVIRGLWEEVDRHIVEEYYPHLPVQVMQKTAYEQLKLLVDAGSMPVAEWRARTGGDFPNGDPFHPVIRLDNGQLTLDHEALLEIGPEDMYAWHYAVLQAAAEGLDARLSSNQRRT
jgi:hypothetical protein